jgi:hypothetical protein
MVRANVLAPEGRLIIAQQFTAGTANATILHNKSHRDGRMRQLRFNRPYGTNGIGRVTLPSDKSLGYCHTTLRVEFGTDNTLR